MALSVRKGQLGRKPAVHTRKTLKSALVMAKVLDKLGPPPDVSNDYLAAVTAKVGVDWGYMGNDAVGDCTIADTAHAMMLRTANASEIVIPTTEECLALYSAITGYVPGNVTTDNGASEVDVCDYLERVGFLGHKSDATGVIDPSNTHHLKWCMQLFGSCRLGVNLPESAMTQSNTGQPWTVVPGSPIDGGHDVPILYYDKDWFYINTWGLITKVSPEFIAQYCDEAHCELYFDWVRSQGTAPSGFSLDDLASDMAGVLN
jgi:hypothetical protein